MSARPGVKGHTSKGKDGCEAVFEVRVIPRAAHAGIAGMRGSAILVRLNSPPVEGAANQELIELLAKALRIAKGSISIIGGGHNRSKTVRVLGLTPEQVRSLLNL